MPPRIGRQARATQASYDLAVLDQLCLLEREAELARLAESAEQARAGRGSLTVIEAASGLGKTTLLDEAAVGIASRGLRVRTARGSDLERAFSYGIVRQLLERPLRDRQVRERVLVGAAHAAARLLHTPLTEEPPDVSPFPMLHALYWTVANLCEDAPLALLVDDAHDADSASLRFLGYLAGRVSDLPVMIVLACRPPQGSPRDSDLAELLAECRHETLTTAPLSTAAVQSMIEAHLAKTADPTFRDAVTAATGGNAFYVHELLREVAGRRLEPTADNAAWAAELVPPVIVRSLLFRMAALPAASIPLARACAVLGDGASLARCAELADVPEDEAARAADALVAVGIFHSGPTAAFAHPILRTAVLADFGRHAAATWHARAANLLAQASAPPQAVAAHLLRTPPSGDVEAARVLLRAARDANRTNSPKAAADYLRRALDEQPPDPLHADVLFDLGHVEATLGDPAGLEHLREAVRLTVDPAARAVRAIRLADFLMRSGQISDVIGVLGHALEGLDGRDPELALRVRTIRYWAGRQHRVTYDSVAPELPALRLMADGPDSPGRRQLLVYLAAEAAHGETYATAAATLDRALAAPGLLNFHAIDSIPTYVALLTLCALERFDEFEALSERILASAGGQGVLLGFLVVSTFQVLALVRRGLPVAAAEEARVALESAEQQGWQVGAPALVALRAVALIEQGAVDDAGDVLTGVTDCVVPAGFPSAMVNLANGQLDIARGRIQPGVAALLRCGDELDSLGMHSPGIVPWRALVAAAQLADGDLEAARVWAQSADELARRVGGPIAMGQASRVLAHTIAGPAGIDALRASVVTLTGAGSGLELARANIDLGAALRRSGRVTESRDHLRAGLDIAIRAGAVPLAERARDELLAAGARPRPSQGVGALALSPSESRVARMAAQGMTNTTIAQTLFVSRKTVEKHLANAYRKLGIESRRQLDPSVFASESPIRADPRAAGVKR